MVTRYRVYIGEDTRNGPLFWPKQCREIVALTGEYFRGATITEGIGLWEGAKERCAIVEIIDVDGFIGANCPTIIASFARSARATFGQSAVLITAEDVRAEMVRA